MHRLSAVFLLCALSLVLAACSGRPGALWTGSPQTQDQASNALGQRAMGIPGQSPVYGTRPPGALPAPLPTPLPTPDTSNLRPAKVAILLPLSGPKAEIGQAMLQAAQLAVFDMGYENFELSPYDTKETPQAALAAFNAAAEEGAELILGPLFADSTRALKEPAKQRGISMISFSTDWSLAGDNTYVMGFLPFGQVVRIAEYAASKGITTAGILAPADKYGEVTSNGFEAKAEMTGIRITEKLRFPANDPAIAQKLRPFSHYDQRRQTLLSQIGTLEAALQASPADRLLQEKLAQMKKQDTVPDAPYQAVFMPVGGAQAKLLANSLGYYGLYPTHVRWLGTGLLDDPALAQEKSLQGAWFAAPSPRIRKSFETRYQQTYGIAPLRLASLAYDATALAAVLARSGVQSGERPAFDHAALTNPNGFAGMDGIFRFRPDGLVERGMAILEFRNGRIVEIDPAPTSFQQSLMR